MAVICSIGCKACGGNTGVGIRGQAIVGYVVGLAPGTTIIVVAVCVACHQSEGACMCGVLAGVVVMFAHT